MEKKRNNPWYYYLNGKLVKKRKPAMPGDVVLISKPYDAGCKFTVVGEVYIGGFHDQYRKYYPWDEVFRASDVLDELTDLRNFKNHYEYSANPIISNLQDQIEKLKERLEDAWLKTGKATAELDDFKMAVRNDRFYGDNCVGDDRIDGDTFSVYSHIYEYMRKKGFDMTKYDICNIDSNYDYSRSSLDVKFKFVHYSVACAETEPNHYISFYNLPF
jgi:hypothetical protein